MKTFGKILSICVLVVMLASCGTPAATQPPATNAPAPATAVPATAVPATAVVPPTAVPPNDETPVAALVRAEKGEGIAMLA